MSYLKSCSLLLLLGLSSCSQTDIKVVLDCGEFVPLARERLTLESARQAYRWEAMRQDIRFREAIDPGYLVRSSREFVQQAEIDRKRVCYEHIFTIGQLLFEHEFSFADGLGREDAKTRADPFRKVHQGFLGGPETNSCSSCHWLGGPAGSGAVQDNSQLFGDGVSTDSSDARNPPALQGSGVVQALAQEMSLELQGQRSAGIALAKKTGTAQRVMLKSKAVHFGQLKISAKGKVDSTGIEGIDSDLQIKPFGWRGNFATIRDFVVVSTQVHLGMQSEDLLASTSAEDRAEHLGRGSKEDPDNDGMTTELSAGQVTALVVYLAGLEMPVIESPKVLREFPPAAKGMRSPPAHHFYDRFTQGQRLFEDIGCALCHTPMMVLHDPTFRTTSKVTGKSYTVDLSKSGQEPRLRYNEALGGYPVWTFSDFKRHDLGERAIAKHTSAGIGQSEFLTRRLWGLAGSPPYFYDGRAPTVDEAIDAHTGEGVFASGEFAELSSHDKGSLRIFLLSLRRAARLVVP